MKRTLFGLLAGGMALFALSAPTPAKAAVWCGWYGGAWYGRCAVAYTYMRPVVRPVVAVTPYYGVAYRRAMVPYYYTAVAYRPAVMPYTTVAYARRAYAAYAYVPTVERRWIVAR